MRRVLNFCRSKPTSTLIWISAALLFYLTFRFIIENSLPPPALPAVSISGSRMSILERRKLLYDKMARDLDDHGAAFLKGGETSQALSISDLFELRNGSVTPVLKMANPPVRATVLYLSSEYSNVISNAVRKVFLPHFDGVIWFQNTSIYHSSMFHASHHQEPVIATDNEIEAEANAIKAVAEVVCPLKIILDRIVLTSTGVLLGCWQVISGTDPAVIRAKLREALPRAPEKQLYDPVLLHTSFARLLGCPKFLQEILYLSWLSYFIDLIVSSIACFQSEKKRETSDKLQFFYQLVAHLNAKLEGFEATVSELWFVEEYDVLALALDGRMKTRRFPLGCKGK